MDQHWGFLSLPAELRFRIYYFLSPPQTPTSDAIGILLSCKEILEEAAPEFVKHMKRHLEVCKVDLRRTLRGPVQISNPTNLHECNSVHVALPIQQLFSEQSYRRICFSDILSLPLRKLTFSLHRTSANTRPRPPTVLVRGHINTFLDYFHAKFFVNNLGDDRQYSIVGNFNEPQEALNSGPPVAKVQIMILNISRRHVRFIESISFLSQFSSLRTLETPYRYRLHVPLASVDGGSNGTASIIWELQH
ncbi:hypothetical protein P154DRAFT_579439 [Amniculicola lignicola CBS 123094]|uniref:Uncharacterized protein n=1 Tax=Amniculicola lignicola CBS 123094 TaxID=1392246 RepID=A0A6A5W769_9PLEO|nr:hypothetical protein P154DRAFT_579439 [Amniculicola lignicola CBS 123094]